MYCTDLEGGVVATDGPVAVSANGDYATPSGASPEAGTYYWVASYSGDANNAPAASGCEDEQIGRASCRERVQISEDAASLKNNATFKDKATIAGLFGAKPGGQISWKLYDNKECKSAEGGVVATDGPVAVSANGDYATPSGASPEAGTYYWVASYSGDANNAPAASGCEDEPVTVGKAAPSLRTTQDPASGTVGATFKDKATIAGLFGAKPGGQISWKLYDNKECKSAEGGVVATDGPVAVSANGDYATPSGPTPQAGTYYLVASYSGAPNNAPAASGCEDDPVTVGKAAPILRTTQAPASAPARPTFKEKATIAGLFGAKPGGQISWKLYDNKECKSAEGGVVATDGPVAV